MQRSVVLLGKHKNSMEIPDYEVKSMARCILPSIRAFFKSEEGQREFAEWQAKQ